MELNEFQKKAAGAPLAAAIKVEAGAGTGKTSVLVERYLKLVQEDGISPERILALTFTKKAASEMRRRIFKKFESRPDKDVYRSLYRASITNFHSFCHRLISEDPANFPGGTEFGVASEVELQRIIRSLYRDFEAGRIEGLSEDLPDEDLAPSRLRSFFDGCMAVVDKCRGMAMRPEDLTAALEADDDRQYRDHVHAVAALWNAYEDKLHLRSLLDFSALIDVAVRSLKEDGALRERIAGRFDGILVDEFQDTSGAQNELLLLLSGDSGGRMTVVGDDKQSIYRWRDARVENMREFGGETVPLTVNYRSFQEILDLAHRFIRKDEWYAERTARLVADRGAGGHPITVFHPAPEQGESPEEEARAVAAWIQSLVTGGGGGRGVLRGYGDAAVLLRSMKASFGLPQLESEFRRCGIPYALVGAPASLENSVLLSLERLLTVLIYPREIEALLFLLEEEPFSLDDADLVKLFAAARTAAKERAASGEEAAIDRHSVLCGEALSALGDGEARERCAALSRALDELQDAAASRDFQAFIWEALETACVFLRLFSLGAEYPAVESVLVQVYDIVEELLRKSEASVSAFIEYLAVVTDEKNRSPAGEPHLPEGRVAVMTIHQAKGLEFSAVAVPGLKPRRDIAPSFYVSKSRGLFLKGFGRRDLEACEEAVRYAETMSQEERCLIYVAMTRAKDRLFLSSPQPLEQRGPSGQDFFPGIMECLVEGGIPYVEWRQAPAAEPVRAGGAGQTAGGGEEAGEESLERWLACRSAVHEADIREAPPVRAIQYADWRALRTFASCPLEYYFRYVRRVAGAAEEESGASLEPPGESDRPGEAKPAVIRGVDSATYGSFVHYLLDKLAEPRADGGDRIVETVEWCARLFGFSALSTRDAVREMPGLVRTVLAASFEGGGPVDERLRERPFSIRTGRFLFTGIIDRIDRMGDLYRVIDYKTGEEKEEHRFQVRYYAWALSTVLGAASVEGRLVYIGNGCRVADVDTGADAIAQVERSVHDFERAAAEQRYDAAPGEVCSGCPYERVCPRSLSPEIKT